ncbi:MAG: 23S rRNA (guanosine(2251)-2'-O)-methyltransferase RlmB [Magnetococcales bacterium]|nr:23S rRNA (guanosine(2251)-2'-O)-methyltransferase RlmB [Magnetococcales bacterium]
MTDEPGVIFGVHPVMALLQDNQRPVESVSVQKGLKGGRMQELVELARARRIKPRFVDRHTIERLCPRGAAHQGVAARAGVRRQLDWAGLLDRIDAADDPLLVILDGVSDPHNLGAVIRSAEAFGALAVVTPRDRSAPLSGVAVKASAGAAERLDVVRVTNLARAMEKLRDRGMTLLGFAGEGETSLDQADMKGSVALVMGGEGKGLRRLTRDKCDALIAIPLTGITSSLNVSVATGIALYEAGRQRGGFDSTKPSSG